MEKVERVDLVVVGAGWSGLCAAKTYLELHPNEEIVVFDDADTIGGVWAKHRLYPGLKSNNMVGTFEYPDFEMDEPTYGVKYGQHIPGEVLHRYLNDYAKKFGVYQRTRLNTKVESVEPATKGEQGWLLHVSSPTSTSPMPVLARKLIVATGVVSAPFMPALPGEESFNAPLFHVKDLHTHADLVQSVECPVVLGGTKSAWDAAYAFATRGKGTVHMVIRESGHGPIWMAPPYVTPLKRWLEKLVTTRLLTWFSPCVWGDYDGFGWIRSLLHGTALGRTIVNAFWKILGDDVIALNKYDSHPETAKLKPWTNPMFLGTGLSILNYEIDFFDLVRSGKIRVHIADITSLSDHTVHLSTGETIPADAFVASTGWTHYPPLRFLPEGSDPLYGLPHQRNSAPDEQTQRADQEILSRFPRLADQPPANPKAKPVPVRQGDVHAPVKMNQPYKLYRFMVPPAYVSARSIGFAGIAQSITTTTTATVQALWLCAFFDGKLARMPGEGGEGVGEDEGVGVAKGEGDDVAYEATLHARFGRWRYPVGHGAQYPDFVFDALPYLDMLMGQLGLERYRKGKGWWRDIFQAYGPEDYRGLVGEWLEVNRRKEDVNGEANGKAKKLL